MAEKKKSVTPEEVQEAMNKAENVSMEELRKEREQEIQNQRMDVFPELLAKVQSVQVQKPMVPTYDMVLRNHSCQSRACKLDVERILAEREAEEKLRREKRKRRHELMNALRTAAAILLSLGLTAVCIAGVACLGRFL